MDIKVILRYELMAKIKLIIRAIFFDQKKLFLTLFLQNFDFILI